MKKTPTLFWIQNREWNYHFFQRHSSMLVGISIVTYIVIVIIRIGEEQISLGKNKRAAHVYRRKPDPSRIHRCQYVLILVREALAGFVPQI